VNCYTHYSSIATHSALHFSINVLLASLYSQSQVGSDEASTRTASPTRFQSPYDATSVILVVGSCEETIIAILDYEFLIEFKSRLCAGQLSVETLCLFIYSLTIFS